MRVLMVNAFHYLRGGVERACFDETRWLGEAGHEVAPFAIQDPRNRPSATDACFAPPADYGEGAPLMKQIAQLPRAIWSRPAEQAMERLLTGFQPDVAHVHAPSRYLTPSVLRPLERANVPVVMTVHDFKPWCTNRVMFAKGQPCERCRGRQHWHALATGCVQDSHAKSAIGMVEAYTHDAIGAYRAVRRWIAPSEFALEKAAEWGAPRDRLRLLSHGLERRTGLDENGERRWGNPAPAAAASAAVPGEPYVLFAGRVSIEKGVKLLPALARALGKTPLIVAGEGPLLAQLEAAAVPNLRLAGRLEGATFAALRANARVVIVPSLFYETYGYAVAEALLDARPVVASRIGALPELIEHDRTGLLVPPGDEAALIAAVRRALTESAALQWGAAGRERVLATGDPRLHTEGLLAIYHEAGAAN